MSTAARKARKRAGMPAGVDTTSERESWIRGGLVTFIVIAAAVAGYLVHWLVG